MCFLIFLAHKLHILLKLRGLISWLLILGSSIKYNNVPIITAHIAYQEQKKCGYGRMVKFVFSEEKTKPLKDKCHICSDF